MLKSQEELIMNSKKIISSVSLATAVLATGIISQEAHADSVDTTTTTVSQAQPQIVTAEQVASAKATFENNQEAQAQAQSVADNKKQALDTAKANTVTAQGAVAKAETAVAQATDTNIQVAKAAISEAEAKVQPAKEAVETAKTDVTTKEVSQSQSQEAVNKAQGNVNQAQEAVTEATQIQSEKQAAVDKSAKKVEVAKQGVTNAQATLAEKNSKVSQAKQTVETAKQNDAKLDADTKEAQSKAKLAELDANLKNALASKATVTIIETVSNNPTAIENSSEHNGIATLISSGTPRQETIDIPESMIQDGKVAYTPNIEAITKYLAEYINELRAQNGISTKTEVTTDAQAIAFAQARAQENADRQKLTHSTTLTAPKPYFENGNYTPIYNTTYHNDASIYSDKEYAYRLVIGWADEYRNLYAGFGHFETLLYAKGPIAFGSAKQKTRNAFHDAYGDDLVERQDILHFLSPDGYEDYIRTKIAHTSDGSALVLANGKRAVGLPEVTFNYRIPTTVKDPIALKKAQEAQTRVEQAKAAYDALVATPRQTADAEANLATVKVELANAQEALTTAEQTLATVTASNAEKVAALDMAKVARNEAVNALTVEQNKLAVANQELAQREADTTVAKAKLAELEQDLKDTEQAVIDAKATYEQTVIDAKATYEQLVKAKVNLETARQAYAKAVTAQDAAQVAYDKAIEVLTNAKAQTALSGTKYTNLKATYDARIAYEEAQRKAKEEALRRQAERDAKAKQEQIHHRMTDKQVRQDVNSTQSNRVNSNTYVGVQTLLSSTNEVHTTSFASNRVPTAEATQAVVNRRGTTDYQAPLPQTGESDTAVYLLAGLGVLGLAGVTARKRRG